MDPRYEAYCLADPLFYDLPAARANAEGAFEHVGRPVPEGWRAASAGDRWHLAPADHRLPDQGWKIHVSATPGSAPAVLDTVWDHSLGARLAFAFLRSPAALLARNSVHAERGAAGKFATLYPADEDELERTLKELDGALAGQPGPCVLSDLRYGAGPLYVRYGGFAPRWCRDASGERVPAIADPRGRLVPDQRGPAFAPPPWVAVPRFLAPHLAARGPAALRDLPYPVERALHVGNGGGVYQAADARTGRKVLVKQARPHAGLTADGRDAVARLERERDVLRWLAGTGAAPEVLDWLERGGHRFLVLEFVEGRSLDTLFGERFPLYGPAPEPAAVRAYTAWALGIAARVEQAVAGLHARGVALGGLGLRDVLVRPDGTVALIGFASAATLADAGRRALDAYALACLRLALFLPLTGLLPLDRGRARVLAGAARGEFPEVPDGFLEDAVERIETAGRAALRPVESVDAPIVDGDWTAVRASLGASIAAMATPEREDRLFPGDVRQFAHPGAGLGIAHGAAGVLYALDAAGLEVPGEHADWLVRRGYALPADARLGFYEGVHGVAYVLDALGRREEALRLVDAALEEQWQRLGPDLADGLAGVGLNLLHFAAVTGDRGMRGAAIEAGRIAAELLAQQDAARAGTPTGAARVSGPAGRAGLLRGASGPALLFLRLFERTGDREWLARARSALRMDLACCVVSARDGSMRVNEGWRAVPYLAGGGAGIALVLRRYLAYAEDERFRTALEGFRRASSAGFSANAGLFNGRAGLALALADDPQAAGEALGQVRRLAWHAVGHRGRLAFPGDRLHRLSADLATGSAGVLLGIGAVLGGAGAHLPFLANHER
ncbi:MAG TPA: class III lanthionine synthetase LanKC [Actinospica sp.]|nr:class III lanthionine synthetase LanKC [Actinospica sp.]